MASKDREYHKETQHGRAVRSPDSWAPEIIQVLLSLRSLRSFAAEFPYSGFNLSFQTQSQDFPAITNALLQLGFLELLLGRLRVHTGWHSERVLWRTAFGQR